MFPTHNPTVLDKKAQLNQNEVLHERIVGRFF